MGGSDSGIKKPINLEWMDKKVPYLLYGNWLYRFCCFFLGRKRDKLSYKEIYMIIYGLNKKRIGERKAEEFAFENILKIYKDLHNGKSPKK